MTIPTGMTAEQRIAQLEDALAVAMAYMPHEAGDPVENNCQACRIERTWRGASS